MLKILSNLLLVAALIAMQSNIVLAYQNSDIKHTVHNLAVDSSSDLDSISGRFFKSGTVDQICIFCHTPHNANPGRPLWNKAFFPGGVAYRLYTSSASLTNTVRTTSSIAANSESKLCLGCHDGKSAMNVLHGNINAADPGFNWSASQGPAGGYDPNDWAVDLNGFTTPLSMGQMFQDVKQYPNIGATRQADGTLDDSTAGFDLTNDHPVGFYYVNAYNENNSKLWDQATAETRGARFGGPNKNRVECTSCHDPHVFYGYGRSGGAPVGPLPGATQAQIDRRPFLVRDNIGSALCLACHKK